MTAGPATVLLFQPGPSWVWLADLRREPVAILFWLTALGSGLLAASFVVERRKPEPGRLDPWVQAVVAVALWIFASYLHWACTPPPGWQSL